MNTSQFLKDYHYIARRIAIKNSLHRNIPEPTGLFYPNWLNALIYYLCLFIVVVILAGVLTGFGQAAPVISAIVSLFPFVSMQVGYFALMTFGLYAIPWALVYIPDVSNLFRNFWENWQDRSLGRSAPYNQNSIALDRAHNILTMLYRKHMKHGKDRLDHAKVLHDIGNTLIKLAVLDAIDDTIANGSKASDELFYNNITKRDTFKLGYHFVTKGQAPFDNLLEETALIHLTNDSDLENKHKAYIKNTLNKNDSDAFYTTIQACRENHFNLNTLITYRKELLKKTNSEGKNKTLVATHNKHIANRLWEIQRKHDQSVSRWSYLSEWAGTILGFLNASIANGSGTALAPLYLISTILMIYAVPSAVISFYLSLTLVIAFAASGFISSFGITRKSIEKAFINMSNFVLDSDRANREHKQFTYEGPYYYKPFKYLAYLNKRYSILPIVMSLFISLAIASFNFLAGVTFAHIVLNPSLMMHPTQVATFSIQSIGSLHAFELAFGIIGFGFTVIAVAPLMLCAWRNFQKAIQLEPITSKPWLAVIASLTSLINTGLTYRMMLRPGSPLDLFFGATPWLINLMTYVAPIFIAILGFALFYMGLQNMLSDKGRDVFEIYNETLALDMDFTPPELRAHSLDKAYNNNTSPSPSPANA